MSWRGQDQFAEVGLVWPGRNRVRMALSKSNWLARSELGSDGATLGWVPWFRHEDKEAGHEEGKFVCTWWDSVCRLVHGPPARNSSLDDGFT